MFPANININPQVATHLTPESTCACRSREGILSYNYKKSFHHNTKETTSQPQPNLNPTPTKPQPNPTKFELNPGAAPACYVFRCSKLAGG